MKVLLLTVQQLLVGGGGDKGVVFGMEGAPTDRFDRVQAAGDYLGLRHASAANCMPTEGLTRGLEATQVVLSCRGSGWSPAASIQHQTQHTSVTQGMHQEWIDGTSELCSLLEPPVDTDCRLPTINTLACPATCNRQPLHTGGQGRLPSQL